MPPIKVMRRRLDRVHRAEGLSGPTRRYVLLVALLVALASLPTLAIITAGTATIDGDERGAMDAPFLPPPSSGPVVLPPSEPGNGPAPGPTGGLPPGAADPADLAPSPSTDDDSAPLDESSGDSGRTRAPSTTVPGSAVGHADRQGHRSPVRTRPDSDRREAAHRGHEGRPGEGRPGHRPAPSPPSEPAPPHRPTVPSRPADPHEPDGSDHNGSDHDGSGDGSDHDNADDHDGSRDDSDEQDSDAQHDADEDEADAAGQDPADDDPADDDPANDDPADEDPGDRDPGDDASSDQDSGNQDSGADDSDGRDSDGRDSDAAQESGGQQPPASPDVPPPVHRTWCHERRSCTGRPAHHPSKPSRQRRCDGSAAEHAQPSGNADTVHTVRRSPAGDRTRPDPQSRRRQVAESPWNVRGAGADRRAHNSHRHHTPVGDPGAQSGNRSYRGAHRAQVRQRADDGRSIARHARPHRPQSGWQHLGHVHDGGQSA